MADYPPRSCCGAIYVGGLGAGGNWGQTGKLTYGLQKLTPNSTSTFDILAMRATTAGFEMEYTQPLSAETAANLATRYKIKQWRYQPTSAYGGPKLDEETLTVTSATLSAGGRKVSLAVSGRQVGRVVYVRTPRPFTSDTGQSLWSTEAWYTLNAIPGVTPPPGEGNLALNKPATADSSCSATEGPAKAVNGSVTGGNGDKWCSLGSGKWLQVDLGSTVNVSGSGTSPTAPTRSGRSTAVPRPADSGSLTTSTRRRWLPLIDGGGGRRRRAPTAPGAGVGRRQLGAQRSVSPHHGPCVGDRTAARRPRSYGGWRMSNGEEPFAVRDEVTSRPTFDVTLRGYDKRQVDRYVEQIDMNLSAMAADRARALGQVENLAAELRRLTAELADLRQRPPQLERASFRDLGPMVDQILALAENQAGVLTDQAAQQAARLQGEAERLLADAEQQAAQTLRNLEEELAARRAAQEKSDEERRAAAQAELTRIREAADRLRADGEAAHERARQEAERVEEQSAQQLEQARSEAEAILKAARSQVLEEVQAARAQTQQELAQWQAGVERELNDRRAAVEEEIAEQRTVAERELAAQRTTAEQEIALLIAEAQQYSAKVRQHADEQAAAHQQQLTTVQQGIRDRRESLSRLQGELDTAQQQLAQAREESTGIEQELAQLAQRLGEVRQELAGELSRLAETRRSAESAERHAQEVRARVQREAKRVADLAAAAVMAAAAGGAETAEYPKVNPRSAVDRQADNVAEPPNGAVVSNA